MEASFKFRHYLDQLAQPIHKYSVFLRKEAQKRADASEAAKHAAAANQSSATGANLASYTVHPRPGIWNAATPADQAAVERIRTKLSQVEPFEFIRIDNILFTEDELEQQKDKGLKNAWNPKCYRIARIFRERRLHMVGAS
jgi:hypothetical protein